jgi:hypothetical protein
LTAAVPPETIDAIISQVYLKVAATMSLPEKPQRGSPYAQELISHLLPDCTTRQTARGERLDLQINGQGMCYLILEGTVAVYRRSDDMMLSTARSPALFGLANLTDIYFNDYLKTVSPCLIGTLTTERVNDIIKEKAYGGCFQNSSCLFITVFITT